MNFYKHYIGDFQRDTGHLSLTERGAYLALIHHYYATETPLPNDHAALCRIAGAFTKPERDAVKAVTEFFELRDSVRWHKRIEAELEKQVGRCDKNRVIALAREERKRAGKEAQAQHEDSTNRAQNVPRNRHQNSTIPEPEPEPEPIPSSRHTHSSGQSESPGDGNFPQRVSIAGAVCTVLKAEGIAAVNPGNVDLLALLEAGAEVGNFQAAGRIAVAKGKGFAYALGIVKSQLAEAQRMGTEAGQTAHQPASETTYQRTMRERFEEASGRSSVRATGHVIDITPKNLEIAQ